VPVGKADTILRWVRDPPKPLNSVLVRKTVPLTQTAEDYKCTFGVSMMPGFKDPTTEMPTPPSDHIPLGGVVSFQWSLCSAARLGVLACFDP
jgi:hypothetical protein